MAVKRINLFISSIVNIMFKYTGGMKRLFKSRMIVSKTIPKPHIVHPITKFDIFLEGFINKSNKLIYFLDAIDAAPFYKPGKRLLLKSLILSLGVYTVMKIHEEAKKLMNKYSKEELVNLLEFWINFGIIRFVFHNDKLTQDTVKILDKFLGTEKIKLFIVNQLNRLFRSDVMFNATYNLTKKNLVCDYLTTHPDMENKLSNLMVKLMNNDHIRENLMNVIITQARTEQGSTLFTDNMNNGMRSPVTVDRFTNGIKGFMYDKLSDEIYVKIANDKLMDLIK